LSKGKLAGQGTPKDLVEGDIELARKFLDSSGIAAERLLEERQTEDRNAAARPKKA
jgi:hypothetical protein